MLNEVLRLSKQNSNSPPPPSCDQTPLFHRIKSESERLDTLSSYRNQMDLEIYRDLELRALNSEIRGGPLFQSPLKLVSHHTSCRQCLYAFEIDAYGRGCVHNCSYCYAKEQLTRYGYWNRPYPVPLNIADIRKTFYTIFETNKANRWRELLEKKIPLRIGSMSDSFMWMDSKYKVTLELLKILRHYQYPYIVFTRSDLIAQDEYLNAIDPKISSVQMSISSINDALNRKVEPGAPSAKRRLIALQKLSKSGIRTAVRVNPLFPMHPDGYYSDPTFDRTSAPHLDYFSWDIVSAIADYKVDTLLAGVVRLSPVAVKQFSQSVGIDYSKFFTKESIAKSGDKRFSDSEIGYYYRELKRRCDGEGLRFSTCYIGNGEKDFTQYQSLWSNKSDCCDVQGSLEGFQKSCRDLSDVIRSKYAPNSARSGSANI